MKKVMFSIFILTVMLFVSGCSSTDPQESPRSKQLNVPGQLPIPPQGAKDHPPVIDYLEVYPQGCTIINGSYNNITGWDCEADYNFHATDDYGMIGLMKSLEGPFGGSASYMNLSHGTLEIHRNGTLNLNYPGSYILTYTVTDLKGRSTSAERTFNV